MTPIMIKNLDLKIATTLSELEPQLLVSTPSGCGPSISTLQGFLMLWEQLPESETKNEMLVEIEKHLLHRKKVVDAIASGQASSLG